MKNKILVIITIITSVLVISSCKDEFLDLKPLGALSSDVMGNAEGLRGAVIGCYAVLNDGGQTSGPGNWIMGDMRGGDIIKGSSAGDQEWMLYYEQYQYNESTSGVRNVWSTNFGGANRCTAVMDLLKNSISDEDVSPADKALAEAEVRFLRAHYYFQLKINYDIVPWVDEESEDAYRPNTVENDGTSFVDIWPNIFADMQFAADNLPVTQEDVGRPNKSAAQAYLAKMYMYASQLPSASGVSYNKYSDALNLVNTVISSGVTSKGAPYALLDGYMDNFQPDTENGAESVFSIQMTLSDGTPASGRGANPNGINATYILMNGGYVNDIMGKYGWGFFSPTTWLANHYRVDADGLPYWDMYNWGDDATNGGSVPLLVDDFKVPASTTWVVSDDAVDPRLDWVMGRRGIPFLGYENPDGAVGIDPRWIRDPAFDGPYTQKKYCVENSLRDNAAYHIDGQRPLARNIDVIRFAEVLLWKAELEARVNGDLDASRQAVNQVRQRMIDNPDNPRNRVANSPANYQIAAYPAGHAAFSTVENALMAICLELGLETANEGKRFYDITRFNLGEKALNQLQQFRIEQNNVAYLDQSYIKYEDLQDRYLPLSTSHIVNSIKEGVPTLTQNPNY